jgi:putative membrane protein
MWGYNYGYPMMGYYGLNPLYSVLSIVWIIIVIALIFAIIRWIRRGGRGAWHQRDGHTALDILKERYAKGEINKAEFEEKKKDISA